MDAIAILYESLHGSRGDWAEVVKAFNAHLSSGFFENFIEKQLDSTAKDFNYAVHNAVGQTSFLFINSPKFEYSVRLLAPLRAKEHSKRWLGTRQIVAVQAGGPVHFKVHNISEQANINVFVSDIEFKSTLDVIANKGDMITIETGHQVLDVEAVSNAAILEILVERSRAVELHWTFNDRNRSCYAEQASLEISRVSNVLEIAHSLRKVIPDNLLQLTLDPSRPYVALLALRSMFAAGHADSFSELQRAIDSQSETLSQGSQRLLDALLSSKDMTNAASVRSSA
jgi:hypothetical protein